MANETAYIVASLEDKKAKDLGQVISNENTRKILNLLTKKNATETEISKELNIPLSTIHYNIKQLLKTGLINIKGFYYSKKGNKINVYTLAKKLILIAPKGISVTRSKIKTILPTIFIALALSLFIKLFYSFRTVYLRTTFGAQKTLVAAESTAGQMITVAQISTYYALFFLLGALLGLGIYLLFTWRKR